MCENGNIIISIFQNIDIYIVHNSVSIYVFAHNKSELGECLSARQFVSLLAQ